MSSWESSQITHALPPMGSSAIRHFNPKCQWPFFIWTILKHHKKVVFQHVLLIFQGLNTSVRRASRRELVVQVEEREKMQWCPLSTIRSKHIICVYDYYCMHIADIPLQCWVWWAPQHETALHPMGRPGWKREHNTMCTLAFKFAKKVRKNEHHNIIMIQSWPSEDLSPN